METSAQASSKITVVVADDEPIIVMNLKELLQDSGFHVLATAEDGFGAINQCRLHHPDVLLLDIQMPLLDGLGVSKYVHEEHLAGTIIIVSAFSDDNMVSQASATGVSGYLVKPIDASTLVSTIKVAMARSKELHGLRNEINKVTRDMESRKKIEQAKGLLMKKQNLDEQAAFDMIRAISKEKSMSMETVADIILCGIK
ncbi:MAG: response regulator [Oscillibacter sp.]|nr:response regulator [Oscillibacter sp.]